MYGMYCHDIDYSKGKDQLPILLVVRVVANVNQYFEISKFRSFRNRQKGLNINLNASRPSEHPSIRRKMSKCLGRIIDCKDKTW